MRPGTYPQNPGDGALYLVVILVAMLGWAHCGAHTPDYSDFFGLFHVPQFTSPDRAAAGAYEDRHILFANVLLVLIAVHLVAALWHHFIRRDRVAARMVTGEAGRAIAIVHVSIRHGMALLSN